MPKKSFSDTDTLEYAGANADLPTRRMDAAATRVMPQRHEPPLSRSGRRLQAAQQRPGGPPLRQQPAPAPSSFAKNTAFALFALAAIVCAFFVGQATRQSQEQVDATIEQAVATARQSAVNSYRTAFEKMQAESAAAIAAAREAGRAEGSAGAEAAIEAQQGESRSLFDKVTDCVLRGQC